jgi:hypothetical protein
MRAVAVIFAACTATSGPIANDEIVDRDLAIGHALAVLTSFAPHPAVVLVDVPVRSCTSTYDVDQDEPPIVATSVSLSIPAELADKFVFYTDAKRRVGPLGPRGWSCHVTVAANGSLEILLVDGELPVGNRRT